MSPTAGPESLRHCANKELEMFCIEQGTEVWQRQRGKKMESEYENLLLIVIKQDKNNLRVANPFSVFIFWKRSMEGEHFEHSLPKLAVVSLETPPFLCVCSLQEHPFELVMLMDDSCCVLSDCTGYVDIKYSSESKLDIFLRWYSLRDFLKFE